jgi:hypothetical protein
VSHELENPEWKEKTAKRQTNGVDFLNADE